MKGLLHKEEYGWVVRYKKQTPGPWFEVPIELGVAIKEEYENGEVEFEIISGLNPYDCGNIYNVARLTEPETTWEDILTKFYENYDVLDSREWDKFLEYLKQNYKVPVKK